jgi:hypothetical protein
MEYKINSGKDSQGDEQLFLDDFNKNRVAIDAAKRQFGGDLESAYQRVTGKPWPAGRSVKISGGRPIMTKDRTVKSVLGKYVLPAAAMALTAGGAAGLGPLAGLFGTAAGGAGTAAAGGSTLLAGGAIPAATSALTTGAMVAPSLTAAAAASGLAATAAPIAAAAIPAGLSTLDKLNVGGRVFNTGMNYLGSRSADAANERAQDWTRDAYEQQLALNAAQRAEDLQLNAAKEEALQKRWDAEQAQKKQEYDAREPYRAAGLQSLAKLSNRQTPTVTPYTSRFMGVA